MYSEVLKEVDITALRVCVCVYNWHNVQESYKRLYLQVSQKVNTLYWVSTNPG